MRSFRLLSLLSVVLSAGTAAPMVTAIPANAATAPAVRFTRIQYDSPGADRWTNTSLNAEYTTIKNTSRRAVDLEGWTLSDRTGFTYTFPALTLKAGRQLIVRTGKGDDTASSLYWGRRGYVWNNDGDTAYLRDASDSPVDSCAWAGARWRRGSGVTICR